MAEKGGVVRLPGKVTMWCIDLCLWFSVIRHVPTTLECVIVLIIIIINSVLIINSDRRPFSLCPNHLWMLCVIILIINNARSPLSVVYYYTISTGISIMGGDRHQFSRVKWHLILQWNTGVGLGGGKASIAIVNRESVMALIINKGRLRGGGCFAKQYCCSSCHLISLVGK